MIWNNHSNLEGKHSFLSPSKTSWLNYDDEKLESVFMNWDAAQRGTEIHAHAASDILFGLKYGVKRPKSKTTYNMYVNDAIGYGMSPEVVLYYSPYAFGTADAIGFRNKVLRIHDLKTGVTPAHIEQLQIYAALFCLEYDEDPYDISMLLRIYQNNEIVGMDATGDDISPIMDRIVYFTDRLRSIDEIPEV